MTVASSINKIQYVGNGLTTFVYPFKIFAETDLMLYKTSPTGTETLLALSIDYTVSGVGLDGGGTVTLTVALATGYFLTIIRSVPYTQLSDYVSGTDFPAVVLENDLDRGVMRDQQINEILNRCIRFSPGYASTILGEISGAPPSIVQYLAQMTDGSLQFIPVPSSVGDFTTLYNLLVAADNNRVVKADLQKNVHVAAASAVGSDAYAITLNPAITAYTAGMRVWMIADVANTGAATLDVNGVAARGIKKHGPSGLADLVTGDILVGKVCLLAWQAADDCWLLLNPAIVQFAGHVMQTVHYENGTPATGSTIIPCDNTKPEITEGSEWRSETVVMNNANNILEVDCRVALTSTAGAFAAIALFVDAETYARVAVAAISYSGWERGLVCLPIYRFVPGAATATISIRVGVQAGGYTWYLNRSIGGAMFDGIYKSSLTIREIKV